MPLSDRFEQLEGEITVRVEEALRDLREGLRERLRAGEEEALRRLDELTERIPRGMLRRQDIEPIARGAGDEGRREAFADLLEGLAAIDSSDGQADALNTLLAEARRYASRTVLFLTRTEGAEAWGASGWEGVEVAGTRVGWEQGGGWQRLSAGRGTVRLTGGDCAALCSRLECPLPAEGVLVPMVLRDRVAAALYADRLDGADGLGVEALQLLTWATAQAIETQPFRSRAATPTLVPADQGDHGLPLWDAPAEAAAAAVEEEIEAPPEAAEPEEAWELEEPEAAEPAAEAEEPEAAEPGYGAPDLEATGAGFEVEEPPADETPVVVEDFEIAAHPEPAVEPEEAAEPAPGRYGATQEVAEAVPEAAVPEVEPPPPPEPLWPEPGEADEVDEVDEVGELEEPPELEEPEPWETPAGFEEEPEPAAAGGYSEFSELDVAAPAPEWGEPPEPGGAAVEEPAEAEPEPAAAGPAPTVAIDPSATVFIDRSRLGAAAEPVPPPPPAPPPAEPEDEPGEVTTVGRPRGGAQVTPPEDVIGPGWAFARGPGARGGDDAAHEEARRLARLLVSEIGLYNQEQVEEGRRHHDIYGRLRDDIDRSRQMYEERVDPSVLEGTADYFREELVRILAGGDGEALGMED